MYNCINAGVFYNQNVILNILLKLEVIPSTISIRPNDITTHLVSSKLYLHNIWIKHYNETQNSFFACFS